MFELELFDGGLSVCTVDGDRPEVGATLMVDGIEMEIVSITSIDDEVKMASVEIEYV